MMPDSRGQAPARSKILYMEEPSMNQERLTFAASGNEEGSIALASLFVRASSHMIGEKFCIRADT